MSRGQSTATGEGSAPRAEKLMQCRPLPGTHHSAPQPKAQQPPQPKAQHPPSPRHSAPPPKAQRPQASWVKNRCFFPSEHMFPSWENDGSRSWGWSSCEERGLEPCGSHGGASGHTPSIHTCVFPFYFRVNSAGLTLLGETCFEKFSKGHSPLTFAWNTCLESAREAEEGGCWRPVGVSGI